MPRLLTRFVLAFLLVSGLLNCAQLRSQEQAALLQDSLRGYSNAMRWSDFGAAMAYIERRGEAVNQADLERLKDVRVTSYEIEDRYLSIDKGEAYVSAKIGYHLADSMTVQTITDKQTWWYREDERRWLLDGDLPNFTVVTEEDSRP